MELNIEINEKGFKVVTIKDGIDGEYVFTNWDKRDIAEFSYFVIMYCPLDYDLSNYYVMPLDEAIMIEDEKEIIGEE